MGLVGQARAANPVSTIGYQGVGYYHQHVDSWFASVIAQGRNHKVGTFGSVEEAARARDRMWLHLGRERSLLNFPDEEHEPASPSEIRAEAHRAFKDGNVDCCKVTCRPLGRAGRVRQRRPGESKQGVCYSSEEQESVSQRESPMCVDLRPMPKWMSLVSRNVSSMENLLP